MVSEGNKPLPEPILNQRRNRPRSLPTVRVNGVLPFWLSWKRYTVRYIVLHCQLIWKLMIISITATQHGGASRVRFLSLARSKLRLCAANHRPGYWAKLPCDWPSTAWAYSEQETENMPWTCEDPAVCLVLVQAGYHACHCLRDTVPQLIDMNTTSYPNVK